jgi:hypothetical protein
MEVKNNTNTNQQPATPQPTIADLQKQITDLMARFDKPVSNNNSAPTQGDNPNMEAIYNIAQKQVENKRLTAEEEKEIADLKEFEITFESYLKENEPFLSDEIKISLDLLNNGNWTKKEKMLRSKAFILKTFENRESFEKLYVDDQKQIQSYLDLKDDEKIKQANTYFPVAKRYLDDVRKKYVEEKTTLANKGVIGTFDKKYALIAMQGQKSNSLFNPNNKEYVFKKIEI